ncbi:MAG TPA: ABC transporter permease [Ktedonobacteraceae bacterium]|nr:ABC transporter permease [Ktedonobacteraceae bacterium]
MHLRTILAIARKDAIDILLNKSMLTVLILPIIFALLFLFMGKLIGGHAANILVYNPGQSPVVQVLSTAFDKVHITEANSPADITAAFGPNGSSKDSPYDAGLIVPADFEHELQAGDHPQLGLYLNGNNLNTQNITLIQAALTSYARQVTNPQAPLALSTVVINPPPTTNFGDLLSTFYGAVALLTSFILGTSLMPGLLIEEKERKTLRMLMVTPASFTDVILGKLFVVLGYQLLLSLIALAIVGGFTGLVPLVLLYTLLGSCLSLAIGLLLGATFQTAGTAGAIGGMLSFIYILPAVFSGPLGALFGNNPIIQVMKVFPTYYIADGVYNAMQNQGTFGGHLLDLGIVLGSTLLLLALTTWILRRQSSVAASI